VKLMAKSEYSVTREFHRASFLNSRSILSAIRRLLHATFVRGTSYVRSGPISEKAQAGIDSRAVLIYISVPIHFKISNNEGRFPWIGDGPPGGW
jgi:hypothetical protein